MAGDDTKNEFQYYLIGVYSFFALMFAIGLIAILAKKIQRACCTSEADYDDYDNVRQRDSLQPQDNLGFDDHVSVNTLDIESTHPDNNSDYENYSDVSDRETSSSKDKPPAYEGPPPYSIVIQT